MNGVITIIGDSNRRSLDEIAVDINESVRIANDQRLAIAIKFAEAKALCKEQQIPFKHWVEANIEFVKYPEATKLAKIGEAPEPAKALEDMRSATRKMVKSNREKKVAYVSNSEPDTLRPSRGPQAIAFRVREAILALAGLPKAAEVVSYLFDEDNPDDLILIEERFAEAADWFSEFAEAFVKAQERRGR